VSSGEAFVTGGHGFAGRHLVALLEDPVAPSREELDLLDAEATRRAIADAAPVRVFHLAALASVARSWEDPRAVLSDNLAITVNLLEAVRREAPEAAFVLASSGEIYGPPERLPLTEDEPLRPQNPYAVSKAACDLLAGQYADAHGLRVVRMRAFNQAGPGQSDVFVVSTIARQVAEAEAAGASEAVIRTGNPDSARDFTDVRDTVRAYADGSALPAGAYNVCRGEATSVRALVALAGRVSGVKIGHDVDTERVRAHDVREVRGSADRLASATGWRPEIPLEQTVADAIAYWRARL